jgi:hypothetical protein
MLAMQVPFKIAFIIIILFLARTLAIAAEPNTNELSGRLQAIRDRLPEFKRELDDLKATGHDISYPLVTYTVLDNFTTYGLEELNILAPSGWGMLGVNGAEATAELVKDAHAGQWAIRIVNRTPQHPNVYGMFEYQDVISLKAGQAYTMSVWAKSENPGSTSMTLNASWADRLVIGGTGGQWKRFSKTFTPTSADTAFMARVIAESVGEFLIDDICLVEGTQAEQGKNLIVNGSFEYSWNQDRVGREIGDMEVMTSRLAAQLAGAKAGNVKLLVVPRWDGSVRPEIHGPSFVGPVRVENATERRPIFFVGYGHFDQVRNDIEKFPGYGINVIQSAELGPAAIYPKDGQIDESAIDHFAETLDRAAKSGVAVDWLLSPHVVPDWWLAKYPGLRKQRADFFPYSIYSPHVPEMLRDFAHRVVAKIKDKPALLSICLSNEPINCEEPDENSVAAWHQWLKTRHGNIATLNARWGTKYATYDEVPQPNPLGKSSEPRPGGAWCDFCRWNDEYFADFHKMMADAVHEVAPQLPVHIKATTWHFYRANEDRAGDDAYLFNHITQINGNDSVNLWSFGDRQGDSIERGGRDFAQGWRENALAYELERSTHNAPVFNSENHLIFDRESRYVSPDHIRSALWMGAIHGQSATTLWVWEREKSDPQSVFNGDMIDRASCAEAAGVVCHDLNRVAPQISALQNAPADVLILQSNTAAVWDQSRYDGALLKLFTALSFTGLKPGFLTEGQLEHKELHDVPLLIIPDNVHLSDAAFDGLSLFKGRILFASATDGKLLTRNEYDQPRPRRLSSGMMQEAIHLPATWHGLLPLLQPHLTQAGAAAAVHLVNMNGKPQSQVQWQVAKTSEGLVVNLYNAGHDPMTVMMTTPMTMVDLLTRERLPPQAKITLKSLEVRLLVADGSK